MPLPPEKKAVIALAVAAAAVLLLLPFVFRELEPDYDAAYSMDRAKKGRFASRDETTPVLSNVLTGLSSASAPATSTSAKSGLDVSAHRALPYSGGSSAEARAATQDPAASAGGGAQAAPRLVTTAGLGASGGGAWRAGADASGASDARAARPAASDEGRLKVVAGAADAAKLAQGLGLGNIAGMASAGAAKLDAAGECTHTSARLRPRIASASQAYKRAGEDFKASGCPTGSCGRHAADCAQIQRTPDEEREARRRCSCDRLECRKIETCRAVDDLRCEEAKACLGRAASCASNCS